MQAYEAHEGQVVSLLFTRPRWNVKTAKAWAKKNGYKTSFAVVGPEYVHLRQIYPTPPRTGRTRTVPFGDGIEARMIFHGRRKRVG